MFCCKSVAKAKLYLCSCERKTLARPKVQCQLSESLRWILLYKTTGERLLRSMYFSRTETTI